MNSKSTNSSGCPFQHGDIHGSVTKATDVSATNRDWWPNQLNLNILRQHSALSNPMGDSFNYAEDFSQLDFDALKQDIYDLMPDSQQWWPAD